jgi:hypothetical protein
LGALLLCFLFFLLLLIGQKRFSPPPPAHKKTHSVSVTVIGLDGTRHLVRALPGANLVDALMEAEVDNGA